MEFNKPIYLLPGEYYQNSFGDSKTINLPEKSGNYFVKLLSIRRAEENNKFGTSIDYCILYFDKDSESWFYDEFDLDIEKKILAWFDYNEYMK